MVKEIIHDPMFLAQKSKDATQADASVVTDLKDTLKANLDACVGMAANMIGVSKRIIVVSPSLSLPGAPCPLGNEAQSIFAMINPRIVRKTKPYDAEESCLSLLGGPRKTRRFQEIEVEYLDEEWNKQRKVFTGWVAQIVQHEVDHCDGKLI